MGGHLQPSLSNSREAHLNENMRPKQYLCYKFPKLFPDLLGKDLPLHAVVEQSMLL